MSKAPKVMAKLREYISTLPEDMSFVQDLKAHSEREDYSEELRLKLFSIQSNQNEYIVAMLDNMLKEGASTDPRTKVIVGWDDYFRALTNDPDVLTDDDKNEIDQIVNLEVSYMENASKENN